MITPAFAQTMARYNQWQNQNLIGGADKLPQSERSRQTGAFFGSIQGTFAHLMWADQAWMQRFDPTLPPPRANTIADSAFAYADWAELKLERAALDAVIIDWAAKLAPAWLDGKLTFFSKSVGREVTMPKMLAVPHFFNHQTHHRGQIHCMLTQAGVKPGDTDLPKMFV